MERTVSEYQQDAELEKARCATRLYATLADLVRDFLAARVAVYVEKEGDGLVISLERRE